MVTLEENNTLKPLTAEEVVPVSSEAKVVLLMLEVVLVDPDSAVQRLVNVPISKELLVEVLVKDLLHHQWLEEKVTLQAVVKVDVLMEDQVVSPFLTMVTHHSLLECQLKNFHNL